MSKFNYLLPIALLASSASFATTEDATYVGARLGGTHYSDFSTNGSDDIDEDSWGGGVFMGHNMTDWFAFEVGYTYLGETEIKNAGKIEQKAVDIVGKFSTDLTESLDVFAKVGGAHYMTEGKDALSGLDDSKLILTAGLGLEYFFTKNVSTRLEYQYYHEPRLNDNGFHADWDTHFYGVSLVYSWGGAKAPVAMAAPVVVAAVVEPEPEPEPAPVVVAEPIVIEPLTVQIRFANNSTEIQQQYIDQLAPVAQHLIDHPEAELFIVGHTDSQGAAEFNQKLSEQRAEGVAAHLSEVFNLGLDKKRAIVEGRGESEPIATNETSEGRAENRRVSVYTPGLTVPAK